MAPMPRYRPPAASGGPTDAQFETLAAVILTGSYAAAAVVRAVSLATIKRHLQDLHTQSGLLTVQLAYVYRAELALYFAAHQWPEPLRTGKVRR